MQELKLTALQYIDDKTQVKAKWNETVKAVKKYVRDIRLDDVL